MVKKRISTSGQDNPIFSDNPFTSLSQEGLPEALPTLDQPKQASPKTKRGRIDVRREKSGRGGKEVTVISGFTNTTDAELEQFLKTLKNHLGTGGTRKGPLLEIQGNRKEEVIAFFKLRGYAPVSTGG